MRTVVTRNGSILVLLLLAGAGVAFAQATPPALVNYQGVLRDGTGDPENGSFEMIFRFFDASGGGSEIVFDEHCAVAGPAVCGAEKGAVTVTSGLFSTQLGAGNVVDGAGAGVYGSLAEAFRDFSEVWMQIEIFEPGGAVFQVLSPRVRVLSAAYSLNADHLDGRTADFFLDSSGAAQAKSGPLTIRNTLTVDSVPGAPSTVLTETGLDRSDPGAVTFNVQNSGGGGMALLVNGSPAWHAGNDGPGSGLDADLLDGTSSANFLNTGAAAQTKAGNLTVADLTVSGNDLSFGNPASSFLSSATSLAVLAGDLSTDDLVLRAAASSALDGAIFINGDGPMQIIAGDGTYTFYDAGGGLPTVVVDATGNLHLEGDLTVSGDNITFGSPGASLAVTNLGATLTGGDVATDDVILRASSLSNLNGALQIFGGGAFQLISGGGSFQFINSFNVPVADLGTSGDLQLDGELTASGVGTSTIGGTLDVNGTSVLLTAGTVINVGGVAPDLTIDGATMDINLGGSAADDVLVPGDLTVSGVKAFVQNHPTQRDLSVVYVALEGDESGTYTRGSSRLAGGEARVPLGETFGWVTSPEIGLTAHVTPRGGWADLYVVSVTPHELVLRSRDGADADFDYVVYGLRIGYEDVPVVQNRKLESKVPAEGFWSALYDGQPELQAFSPRSRFQKMRGDGEGASAAEDRIASRALRQGIGENQPGPDSPPGEGDVAVAAGAEAVGTAPAPPDTAVRDKAGSAAGSAGTLPMDSQGNVYARSFRPSSGDLASLVPVAEAVTAGDVLVIDPGQPGRMSLARTPEDSAVFGVVAGEPGIVLGASLDNPGEGAGASVPVALSGIVLCKVDAGYGAIRPGDLLTTSATPGHAGRAESPKAGTILGKALDPLESGTGLIRVLVTLR